MRLPNAEAAIIAPEKLRDYLLNVEHRRGASKAKLLLSMGYRKEDWQQLESDLRLEHLTAEVTETEQSAYGEQYAIVSDLTGPNGRTVSFRTIWQIDIGAPAPRLITMYPEESDVPAAVSRRDSDG